MDDKSYSDSVIFRIDEIVNDPELSDSEKLERIGTFTDIHLSNLKPSMADMT